MIRHLKAALCAATFLCASQAQAANFLIVDIAAVGTGLGYQNVGSTVQTSTFTTFFASLSYNLEGIYTPQIIGNTLSVIGENTSPSVQGLFTATGFNFSAIQQQSRSSFNITGKGCYANSNPTAITTGPPALDASCSAFSVSNFNASAMASYNFLGTVTGINFRVVEASALPAITFAIPEPSTWALMLAGFGMVGYAMRRRRQTVAFA